jgi:hypothetical protein
MPTHEKGDIFGARSVQFNTLLFLPAYGKKQGDVQLQVLQQRGLHSAS